MSTKGSFGLNLADARARPAWMRSIRLAVPPAIATPRAVAVTSGLLYLSGAVLSLVSLTLPQQPGVPVGLLRIVAVLAFAFGVGVIWQGHRLPRWSYHVMVLIGEVVIVTAVYESGGGVTSIAYTLLFMFVGIDIFFFFAWPQAILHLIGLVGACVGSLASVGGIGYGQAIMMPGSIVVVAVLVGWLVRAADAAEIDALTGLLNRRGLDRAFADALARAEQGDIAVTLALLDIDHFKSINDNHGHVGGDRFLRSVAQSWRAMARENELLGRYGGDEFALLLIGSTPDEGLQVAERLRAVLPAGFSCSAGLAGWEPGDTMSLLTARADVALYEAKREGRDRTNQHDGNSTLEIARLRQALEDGELAVHYQPVVDLTNGEVSGVEALVRWLRPGPDGPTVVSPDSFIPLAELSGLIDQIGHWVLLTACRQAAAWTTELGRPLVVNVNVSGRELRDVGYADSVMSILTDTGLAPAQLVLELTETAIDGSSERVISTLAELRVFGVRVAIDDFGTGYSSLSRLDWLPVDVLKIDRSFVSALSPEAMRAPLVAAIIAMAGALGLSVVAEGIEGEHQAALLRTLGCDEGQGYWLGRPVSAESIDLSPRQLPVRYGDLRIDSHGAG